MNRTNQGAHTFKKYNNRTTIQSIGVDKGNVIIKTADNAVIQLDRNHIYTLLHFLAPNSAWMKHHDQRLMAESNNAIVETMIELFGSHLAKSGISNEMCGIIMDEFKKEHTGIAEKISRSSTKTKYVGKPYPLEQKTVMFFDNK